MRYRILTPIALAIAFVVVACLPCTGATPVLTPPAERPAAPDFTLSDAKGAPIALSTFKGKVVLLDVWAT